MTKPQAHRSQKLKGHYERQFGKTAANKARRQAKRVKRKAFWKSGLLKKNGKMVNGLSEAQRTEAYHKASATAQ